MKKILSALLVLMVITANTFAQSRYRNTALDSIAKLVNVGYTELSTLNIAYPATAIVYIKFYDSKLKPVASRDTPVITLQVGTDATLSYKLQSYSGVKFKNGLWIRCVTGITDTAAIAVQPSTKPIVEITY